MLSCECRSFALGDDLTDAALFWSGRFRSILSTRRRENWWYRLQLTNFIDEVFSMAKKKGLVSNAGGANRSNPVVWSNVRLNDDQAMQFEQWLAEDTDVSPDFIRLVADGYSITLKPDDQRKDVFCCIIISPAGDDGSRGGLSSFADTPYVAFACSLYKLVNILGGAIPTDSVVPSRRYY